MKRYINPISVQEQIKSKNIRFFTPVEFQRMFHITSSRAKYYLETYTHMGLFARLKKGLYVMKNQFPSEEEIACMLYRPSYISFEYALARHGIIPEMVYSITSATTKPTREFFTYNKEFVYLSIKKSSFTGYSLLKEGPSHYLMADPEKAFIDLLYFVSLGKRTIGDRLNTHNLKKEKAFQYARLYKRQGLIKLVEKYDLK
ncbi:MAG: hypothetical protein ABII27_07025 [bacterium]